MTTDIKQRRKFQHHCVYMCVYLQYVQTHISNVQVNLYGFTGEPNITSFVRAWSVKMGSDEKKSVYLERLHFYPDRLCCLLTFLRVFLGALRQIDALTTQSGGSKPYKNTAETSILSTVYYTHIHKTEKN